MAVRKAAMLLTSALCVLPAIVQGYSIDSSCDSIKNVLKDKVAEAMDMVDTAKEAIRKSPMDDEVDRLAKMLFAEKDIPNTLEDIFMGMGQERNLKPVGEEPNIYPLCPWYLAVAGYTDFKKDVPEKLLSKLNKGKLHSGLPNSTPIDSLQYFLHVIIHEFTHTVPAKKLSPNKPASDHKYEWKNCLKLSGTSEGCDNAGSRRMESLKTLTRDDEWGKGGGIRDAIEEKRKRWKHGNLDAEAAGASGANASTKI
ncbi:hypothetical protein N7481_002119 [Penicillium waksmanii]|uniref:uncharacterized protein n=1 Tax=Penicillium waksmanii TaxID=69791 RepID=UPI002549803D|nr:uncharacterized protein N7481_002119 [Penicillium waksmanii]KAJ5995142.1 hypothetical protein N7481_002119 [Penicillium waksmanii]